MKMFNNWKILLALSIVFLLIVLFTSIASGLWVILSLGVGFLFGFALHKGDLCGSSAMSEVILLRDRSKLFGLWIAIVSSMVGFAILHSLGIIELAPKKFIWLSALLGGFIFGIGTVFGGGCVSGCLYKGAAGNINSISALLAIPIGISLVEYGPLKGFSETLKTYVVNDSTGNAITLHSVLGLPYWLVVLIIALVTVVFAFISSRKKKSLKRDFSTSNIFKKSWKPWQAGIAIGIIGVMAWLSSLPIGRNYPLGVTHGVNHVYQMIIDDNVKFGYKKPPAKQEIKAEKIAVDKKAIAENAITPVPEPKKVSVWLMLSVIGLVMGAHVSARMSGQAKMLPKEPSQTLIAMFGGLLIGIGAAIATGCVIGNIISGWAMLGIGTFVFGIATLIGNWITTYFYLIGTK